MRIQNIEFKTNISKPNTSYHTKPYGYDSVNFSARSKDDPQLKKAQHYANMMKIANVIWPFDLQDYDMEKIEGIQTGIPVFDGLTMPEIAFAFEDLHAIAVKRGCSNQCLHCYADAKPPGKEHDGYITRMPFEDFVELTSGIKTLRTRIGQSPIKYNGQSYTDLFYDADGMEISLFDKNGVEHDFTELNDILYDATKSKAVFDTAGWNPNNKKMQQRAEKYVKYFLDMDLDNRMHQINLSISPFNSIYAKAIELGFDPKDYNVKNQPWHPENSGKELSKGESLYNIYINRVANMLMTFLPLLGDKKFSVIARPVKNFESNMKYHTEDDYFLIKKQVMATLREKLNMDLASERKYVKGKSSIQYILYSYSTMLNQTDTDLIMSGRFEKLYKEKNPDVQQGYIDEIFDPIADFRENFERLKTTKSLKKLPKKFLKILDANGQLYLYDGFRSIPTEVALNISSKTKITPKIEPSQEEFVVTKDMIKKKYQ